MALATRSGITNTGVVSDPIGDMLTRIRNGNKARKRASEVCRMASLAATTASIESMICTPNFSRSSFV